MYKRVLCAMFVAVAGCNNAVDPRDDYDGDGRVTFRDLERHPRPTIEDREIDNRTFDQRLDDHVDRQSPDFRQRVREGKAFDF